jgi:hypothetical protein
LPTDITLDHADDLTFPEDVHRLIAHDRPPRCLATEEPESGIDSPFYKTMILLNHIVEVSALAELILIRQASFRLYHRTQTRMISAL